MLFKSYESSFSNPFMKLSSVFKFTLNLRIPEIHTVFQHQKNTAIRKNHLYMSSLLSLFLLLKNLLSLFYDSIILGIEITFFI